MNILPLINDFLNNFNKNFENKTNLYELETYIVSQGDKLTKKLLIAFIEGIDLEYKFSKVRKEKYTVKETRNRILLTSIGYIDVKFTFYKDRQTKKEFCYIRDVLGLKPYQRMTDTAEYKLVKYAMEDNMASSGRHAIRDTIISRTTVSRKIKAFKGSLHEDITKTTNQPKVLYIEMDEVHANLQNKSKNKDDKPKNRICPCAIVHEGHKDELTKRKKLKNVRNFATAKYSYDYLWEEIYDYCEKKYDLDKFDTIFVSGDGASGIKEYTNVFPNAIFVLDPFHYKKYLKYLFKDDNKLIEIADSYLRNNNINDFKTLIKAQINLYPSSKKYMLDKQKLLLNNLDGIKNQHHELYNCPCSMEGHVSNKYARYITSSPYAFSLEGLQNKLQLLVLRANKVNLTFEDYLYLKYSDNEHDEINDKIKKFKTNFKLTINQYENKNNGLGISLPILDSYKDNNYIKELLSPRHRIRYI